MAFIKEQSTKELSKNDFWRNVRDNTFNTIVLVIHDFLTACVMAQKNEVYYITDDIEKKNLFVRCVINNVNFGNDDKVELIDNWCEIDTLINEKFGKNMKFDLVIGNPPYEGKQKLYLKILIKLKKFSNNIIWLCPTNWIDWPVNCVVQNKKEINTCINFPCDFIFEDKIFKNDGIDDNVGIFHFNDNGKTKLNELYLRNYKNKTLVKSIIKKLEDFNCHLSDKMVNFGGNAKNKNIDLNSYVLGFNHYTTESKTSPNVSRYLISNKISINKNNDFEINKKNILIKKMKEIKIMFFVPFKTKEEVYNFENYICNSLIAKFAISILKREFILYPTNCYFVPFFDFNEKWSDLKIKNKLNLTDQEYNYICKEMAKYK